MLAGQSFYHDTVRRHVVAFTDVFSDLAVVRRNDEDEVVQRLVVPVVYGPRRHWFARQEADPDLRKPDSIVLPRIGFEFTAFSYDPSRRLQRTIQNVSAGDDQFLSQFSPSPWNINVFMSIGTRNQDDGLQIIEQILPYFGPELTVAVNIIPQMGITMNVPVVLLGVSHDNVYEGTVGDNEINVWNLDFIIKTHLYGRVSDGRPIRKVRVDYDPDLVEAEAFDRVTTEPNPSDAETREGLDEDRPYVETPETLYR